MNVIASPVPAQAVWGRHSRRAVLPATLLGLVVAVVAVAGAVLIVAADLAADGPGYETRDVAIFGAAFPVLPVMGVLIARRRPAHPIGWLFLWAALAIAVSALAHGYGDFGIYAHPGSLPFTAGVMWFGWTGWVGFALLAVFVPLVYPDGRLPPGRVWRAPALLGGAAAAAEAVVLMLRPGAFPDFPAADFPGWENPFGVPALGRVLDDAVVPVAGSLLAVSLLGAVASLAVRFRRGGPDLRRQIRWLAWATVVLAGVDVIGNLATGGRLHHHPALCSWGAGATRPLFGEVVPMLLYVGLPVAVGVAVLRHQLWDIDRLIRRSAAYAVLCAAITVAYAGVAWALGMAATGRLPVTAAVLLTIVATLVFQPARRRLEALADHWIFGVRPTGVEVATGFGALAEDSTDLDQLATALAEIVRRGLDLDWVRVRLEPPAAGAPAVAAAGAGHECSRPAGSVPIVHQGRLLGVVECGPATDGRPLDRARAAECDALLDLLAREAGLAAHSIALAGRLAEEIATVNAQATELSASRARIVECAETERRRLERDLHDGAQQELVAILTKLSLASKQVGGDLEALRATIADLRHDAHSALAGIRELAQGIHPSVLGDLGLVAAVEDRTTRFPVRVIVRADHGARACRVPQAVEGAAYFVVSEALTNVLKHARASEVIVAVAVGDGRLVVDVTDDGVGYDPARIRSDGLGHLADRVAALGGSLAVRSAPGRGSTVSASLPVDSVPA